MTKNYKYVEADPFWKGLSNLVALFSTLSLIAAFICIAVDNGAIAFGIATTHNWWALAKMLFWITAALWVINWALEYAIKLEMDKLEKQASKAAADDALEQFQKRMDELKEAIRPGMEKVDRERAERAAANEKPPEPPSDANEVFTAESYARPTGKTRKTKN